MTHQIGWVPKNHGGSGGGKQLVLLPVVKSVVSGFIAEGASDGEVVGGMLREKRISNLAGYDC